LFIVGADGFPVVQVEHLNEETHEAAEEAVDLCPSGAIALVEE
jgi:ferredoxin